MTHKMLRSLFLVKSRRTVANAIATPLLLVSLLFISCAGTTPAIAQKKRQTATPPQANTNTASGTAQRSMRKKLTAPRSSESSEGSRVTIASDGVLNDYSAYRSGNRFYVVIPEADAAQATAGLRGRGFENAQVQKRGGDAVISFQLQPGTAAHVNQKFNKLDVVFSVPGGGTSGGEPKQGTTPPPKPVSTPRPSESVQPTPTATPVPVNRPNPSELKQPISANVRNNTPLSGIGINAQPNAQASPGSSGASLPSLSPVLPAQQSETPSITSSPSPAPTAEQIAQQTQPVVPVTTGADSSASSSASSGSLGAVVARNWPLAVIAALILGVLGVFLARRSMSRPGDDVVAQRAAAHKERLAGLDDDIPPLPASTPPIVGDTNAFKSAAVASTIAAPFTTSSAAPPVTESVPTLPVVADEETKEVELVAPVVDVERADVETQNALVGEPYDETVVGAKDAGTRQFIAAGLLVALAGRNIAKRDNARAAFIKHGYFEDATRDLRTAEAPAERVSAARSLSLVRDTAATPHLVAALEDSSPDVRRAAVEALAEVRDPQAVAPLEALRDREKNRKIPRALIQRAIEASVIGQEKTETPPLAAAPAAPAVSEEIVTEELTAPHEIIAPEESAAPEEFAASEAAAPIHTGDDTATIEAAPVAYDSTPAPVAAPVEEEASLAAPVVVADEVAAPNLVEESALTADETPHTTEAHAPETFEPVAPLPTEAFEAHAPAFEQDLERDIAPDALAANAEPSPLVADHAYAETDNAAASGFAPVSVPDQTSLTDDTADVDEDAAIGEFESNFADEAITATHFAPPLSPQQDIAEPSSATPWTTPASTDTPDSFQDSLIERNDGTAQQGWVEVDMSEPEIISHAAPSTTTPPAAEAPPPAMESFETFAIPSEAPAAEPLFEERVTPAVPETSAREIEVAVSDKGIVPVGEDLSTVPSAILKRLASEEASERAAAVEDLARVSGEDAFREISAAFDDPEQEVCDAAARALFSLNADRAASFTRALREAPPERRRKIGTSLSSSGLAAEAIGHLSGESREKTYDAFSLLFLMSKAGEVQPLMKAIEEHPNNEVRLAVVKLLALSGQQEILPAFRRLAVRGSLPTEVRSAVMEAIYQISSQSSSDSPSAA
ncbi:MAG: HEAT repeat domain-containing protein [Pyrinomonadaceae bacterium]